MLNGYSQNRRQVSSSIIAVSNTNIPAISFSPHTFPFSLPRVSWFVVSFVALSSILTFVTVTLPRSGHWTHHSPRGSDLPPDLAQTVIRANQHTSQ